MDSISVFDFKVTRGYRRGGGRSQSPVVAGWGGEGRRGLCDAMRVSLIL